MWNHENTSDYYSWTLKIFSIFNIYNCFCMMVVHFFIVIISYYCSVSCTYKIRKLSFDLSSNQANFSQLLNHNIGNLCCLASSKILFHYFSTTFNSFKSLVSLPTFLHLKESLSSNICVPWDLTINQNRSSWISKFHLRYIFFPMQYVILQWRSDLHGIEDASKFSTLHIGTK